MAYSIVFLKKRFSGFFLISVAAIILVSSCRGTKPVAPRFYLLEFPATAELNEVISDGHLNIEIMEVEINPAYASFEIGIREKGNEIRYFAHNHWAVRPGQSLLRFMAEYYNRNDNFMVVEPRYGIDQPYFQLLTNVHQLEVVSEGRNFYARVHLNFKLREPSSNRIVLEFTSDKKVPLDSRDLNLFAMAVSELFFSELDAFSSKILHELLL